MVSVGDQVRDRVGARIGVDVSMATGRPVEARRLARVSGLTHMALRVDAARLVPVVARVRRVVCMRNGALARTEGQAACYARSASAPAGKC